MAGNMSLDGKTLQANGMWRAAQAGQMTVEAGKVRSGNDKWRCRVRQLAGLPDLFTRWLWKLRSI